MRHRHFLLAMLAILSLSGSLTGQERADRPRVGLVLSGGGARGFAHLGLLKVLDELHVPVDYVAGTSMGSVVGGLFAQGMTYAELEAAFRSEDWAEMFRDGPRRQELPMRRKRQDRDIRVPFEVGLSREGLRLPPAFVSGAKLTNALRAYTYRSRGVERFDDLPIPFRAVATDVKDGSMVVLDHGSLAEAIRASMAVPGAFAPQEIDGRVLVDGGLVRNVPIDAARAMGAEVFIVCDVSTSLDESPEGTDAISLALRLITVVTWGSSREQVATLTQRDVSLRPDLTAVSSADFGALDAALAAGETVARAAADQLRGFAVPAEEYEALKAHRASLLPATSAVIPSAVRIDASGTALSPRAVASLLAVEPGDTVSLHDLREDLVRVLGYGGFQSAEFRVFDEGDQEDILEVRPQDKSWGPWVVRAGVSLRDQQRGAGGWALRTHVGKTRLTSLGGEVWGEVEMGTRHGLRAWGDLPLGHSEQWFAVAGASLGRREIFPTDILVIPLQADLLDREISLGLGARLGSWGEVVAEAAAARSDVELPTQIDGETPRERQVERSVSLRLEGDRLDRVDFPSSGHWLRVGYREAGKVLGGDQRFRHLQVEWKGVRSVGRHTGTFDFLASSGLGSEVMLSRAPALGGIQRITMAGRDGLWGGYAGMAKVTWGYRVGSNASDPGTQGLRLGFSFEGGQAWQIPADVAVTLQDIRWGGSVWTGLETPLGPVIAAFGLLEGARSGWVIRVGSPY